ncbi:hypothetical protein TTHERM_00035500 (macronuclear) [Tetrahymena thermophila SB210]|uniref:Uncharacterized protein n=1 Tax=Tetrahymena thermophila (strain SB210) TaxID=312017 RepID=Q22MH0_TETTS|nr:hypothetical protein TTHERM_00035500 [Tetrahymena thermophila SB210]EAR86666.2 hypothetical protein TTHERM_00035500 [Tetrahymena thermophila SB210]|eukprot:XP_977050.2 hypothetical protein TTHERM_00035500 [Tetrahymena thermophila SB210]
MQQRLQHNYYDSNHPSQAKTPQNHHSQYESLMESPQIDQRTPKCITQRNSQIVSNNALSPYLRNIIINEQQLNQQLESTPSEITQYVQQKAKQIPYNQQNFSGGNIISSQQQQLKESSILNNHSNNGRSYNQNQQNFRSAQLTNNQNQFLGIENDNPLDIRNDRHVISNAVNDTFQHEINYSNNKMNNPLNNYIIGNQMNQGNKEEQNNYYVISSLQSTSQNGSVDVSQYGNNSVDNKYPYQQNYQSGQNYSSKLQNDMHLNQIKNIEQENLLSQMQEKIKFLTTENEEQKKKIRNFNQQVQNGGGKGQTTHLYEKLNTISNQIESLSNSQLKLDLKKLNTQNSSQFRIDSSRSQITKSEFDHTPKESIQMENLDKYRKTQTKNKQKSKNHHRHKKNSSHKKKRNHSSSNSSITSSSNSSNYSGSSRSQSSSSSFDSDQEYGKYLRKNNNKVKVTKEYNSKREDILQDRSKNISASKREKSKSKHRKQKTEDEILKLGSLLIKEVNLNRKLRDLFMNTIGSTEQFRRMLVEKKFTNAFLGVLKVFLDVLTIISFNKKTSSPPTHSPSSYSPMNQLTNTSTFTTQSNVQQRNPILSQSRFNIPPHLHLKNLDPQSQPFINQNFQSPQNGYIGPYMTDRIYSQHSNGQHSPLTSHSFVSVKQGNQHFPASTTSQRDYSPLDHGLNSINNQQNSNIYYQMHGQNQQLRQKANINNNGNHVYDLNLSNINRKTSNHNMNSQSVTGQNSGSDTYRQQFESFNHPSPTIIQNKHIYQSQNDIQKFVSSPYFNNANSSSKKQLQEEGIKIQQHYMRKLNNENDWNENSIQDENEQFEEIQNQNNLRSNSNNRTQQKYDKSKQQQKQQIINKQTQFQDERGYQNPNKQNYQYDDSEYSQNILISKQNSIQSQNSHVSINQKSYQNLQQKSNTNHENLSQSRNKSRSTSPYNQINQEQSQNQQNKVRQVSHTNQNKQTENMLSVQRLQNKSINHVISPRSAISPLKSQNMYQISSSVPEIEMDSDSQEVTQQSNKQNQTLKKQQKNIKNDKLAASTRNKSSNRSFVFDDDQLSSNSTTNNKQKHVGFTPKQSTPRDRDKKSSHSPAIGLMPCMKLVRASHNGALTPSKASIVNIKADLSSKGSHTNLDSKNNSFYSNKNQSTNELHKPIKQSPISIEFVGAKRKIQPESSKTRDFDIINGNTKQQQNHQNTQVQQIEKKEQNQLQIPQIKILDADPTTPNSQNKQNNYHTDNTQTPTLKTNGQ